MAITYTRDAQGNVIKTNNDRRINMEYKDINDNQWFAKDIERLSKAGIMGGYPDGKFLPNNPVTRAELAAVLARLTFRMCLLDGILNNILPAVVTIVRNDGGLGTGFYISKLGYLITAKHVVEGNEIFTVIDEGQNNHTAKLITTSSEYDLALLKADCIPPSILYIAPDDAIYSGKHIAIIGSPKGYTDSITQGVVSHPKRPNNIVDNKLDVFQTDAAINPGNSGGPAIDGNGLVVGVAVWKYAQVNIDNMAFCIRCDILRKFLKENGLPV